MDVKNKIPLTVIIGATASGKSSLALKLAEKYKAELISGDSMQIYRGMDIGTAKPSAEEQKAVKHHLIDIAEIDEPFSAGLFVEHASKAAQEIYSRGKMPILVGGTGLYIDLLTGDGGFSDAQSDERIRQSLETKVNNEGANALHDYLKILDPDEAEKIHPNNVKRVMRAVEIFLITGKTKTQLNAECKVDNPFDRTLICLEYKDREVLYERINKRVDIMVEDGLVQEARMLWERGLKLTKTASQAIGYKELFPYFEGFISLEQAVCELKKSTRNYAKRQITYFKRLEDRHSIFCDSLSAEDIFNKAVEILEKKRGKVEKYT